MGANAFGGPSSTITRIVHRIRTLSRRSVAADEGSGTMAGMALVTLAAVLLTTVVAVGNLFICQAQARAASDLAALSGALVLWESQGDACATSDVIADKNGGRLDGCEVTDDDVTVEVAIPTRIPFIPVISATSRAGPEDCR